MQLHVGESEAVHHWTAPVKELRERKLPTKERTEPERPLHLHSGRRALAHLGEGVEERLGGARQELDVRPLLPRLDHLGQPRRGQDVRADRLDHDGLRAGGISLTFIAAISPSVRPLNEET